MRPYSSKTLALYKSCTYLLSNLLRNLEHLGAFVTDSNNSSCSMLIVIT